MNVVFDYHLYIIPSSKLDFWNSLTDSINAILNDTMFNSEKYQQLSDIFDANFLQYKKEQIF